MLAVLLALLWWQSRWMWGIHNPMYGWPMPFNNVWYDNFEGEWRPSILILDIGVWLILAGSVGYVLEGWRRKPDRYQLTPARRRALLAVAGVVFALGCVEIYLRLHPNNEAIVPQYARLDLGHVQIWFDIGLFTAPPFSRLWGRIVIMLAIGCTVYTAGCLSRILPRVRSAPTGQTERQSVPTQDVVGVEAHPQQTPELARILILLLMIAVALLSVATLFPPAIR
jgi:hypothetical protein